MNWQKTVGISGVALVVTGMFPAHAQKDGIERALAGIRINASSKEILRVFGNPNDIQIGDVAVRPPTQAGGQGGTQGMPGMGGGADDGGGMPGMGGRGMGSSGMSGMGSSGMSGMGSSGMMGGGSGGKMGAMSGSGPSMGGMSGMSGSMGSSGMSGMSSSSGMSGMSGSMGSSGMQGKMGGGGPMGGMQMGGRGSGSMMGAGTDDGAPLGGGGMQMGAGGGAGGGIGAFGQTTSSSTFQQEVTWSYSKKALDAKKQQQAIGYDFLISPEGKVSQIRITGYVPRTAKDKSAKGLTLGSTYKDLIRTYGTPKSVMKSGELLVCSYPTQHIEFQLMNMKFVNGYADPYNGIYKVVAIQINSVE
ncbi:hypothetical protein [Armatimonas sp.]|uniref:hypothetical protein n=1 Tax=Armatimonas sp. TaxID=1872638 RepID=UPI00375047C8